VSFKAAPKDKDQRSDDVRGAKSAPAPSNKSPDLPPEQMSSVEAVRLWLRLVTIA
jgi:hypothetical protein